MKNKKMLTTLLAAFVIAGVGYGYSKSKALDKDFNPIKDSSGKLERIGGSNRYETSMMIAKRLNSKKAYVVNGLSFADVLSIGPVASSTKSPIILATDPDDMNKKLKSLGIENVTIVGGESSVSKDLFDSLKKNFSVNRIAGKDRYDTSEKIVRAYGGKNVGIATGKNFPDALSASPFLAKKNMMLLLVRGENKNEVPNDLNALYTFGGENSVKYTLGKRIDGSDRYQTSEKIVEEMGVSEGLILSSGSKFTDSLSVSPLAYSLDAPILLTDKDGKAVSEKAKSMIESAKKVIMVGGEDSLSKRLEMSVKHKFDDKKVEEELKKLNDSRPSDNTSSRSTSSSSSRSTNSGTTSSNSPSTGSTNASDGTSSGSENSSIPGNNTGNTSTGSNLDNNSSGEKDSSPGSSNDSSGKDVEGNNHESNFPNIDNLKEEPNEGIIIKDENGNEIKSLSLYEGDSPIPSIGEKVEHENMEKTLYIHLVEKSGKEFKVIKYSLNNEHIIYQLDNMDEKNDGKLDIHFEFDKHTDDHAATSETKILNITLGKAKTSISINILSDQDEENESSTEDVDNSSATDNENKNDEESDGKDNINNPDDESSDSKDDSDSNDKDSSKDDSDSDDKDGSRDDTEDIDKEDSNDEEDGNHEEIPFNESTVNKLIITTQPSGNEFFVGDTFDKDTLRNLVITATDENGKTKEYRVDSEDFSNIQKSSDSAVGGNSTLTFTLGNASVYLEYTAFDKNNIRSMEISSTPSLTTYTEGETFAPAGMAISLTDSNGVIRNVKYGHDGAEFNKYGITYSPNEALTTDDTAITFSAGGASTTQNITVNERAFDKNNIVSMVVHAQPTKTEYNVGEKFDPAGMELELTDKNGTKKVIVTDEFGSYFIRHNSNSVFSESDLGGSESNKKTITFDFASGSDASTTLEVTVNKAHSEEEPTSSEDEYNHENFDRFELIQGPTKTVYTEGEDFDPAGMVIKLYDEDGNSKDITSDDFARYDIEIENGQNLRQGNPIKAYFSNTYGITQTENITGITINPESAEETEDTSTFAMPVTGDFYDFESSTNVSLLDTDVFKIDAKNSSSEKLSDWYNSLKNSSARIRIEKIGDFSSSPIELTYASSKDDFESRKFHVNGSTIYIDRNFNNGSGLNSDRYSISIDNGNGAIVNLETNEGSIRVTSTTPENNSTNPDKEELKDIPNLPSGYRFIVEGENSRISNRSSSIAAKNYLDLAETADNIRIVNESLGSDLTRTNDLDDLDNLEIDHFYFEKGGSGGTSKLYMHIADNTTVSVKIKGYKDLRVRRSGDDLVLVEDL